MKEGHEEYAKLCIYELVEEKARYTRRVTKEVNRLLKVHFEKHHDKKTKKINDSEAMATEIKIGDEQGF